jgi:zinc transporter 1
LSIFLEAIQRFVEPQAVSNPKLVLIVGCCGLASNILGLFLFHDHGHSHAGHGHSHGLDGQSDAEAGRLPGADGLGHENDISDESGNVIDVLPETVVAKWPKPGGKPTPPGFSKSDEDDSTAATVTTSPLSVRKSLSNSSRRQRRKSSSRLRLASVDDIHVHPASFRNDIIAASRMEDIESAGDTESEGENVVDSVDGAATENSPLLVKPAANNPPTVQSRRHRSSEIFHHDHIHRKPKDEKKKGGHSHDLNMRGVFLHVMGDALGNIGVIASALIIWLTNYSWRFYSDPAISLVITIIILGSAIPLCRAASRILLQAVPVGINVDDITADIQDLPGVVSCHHLHVWQLSDTKLVASLHIQVDIDFEGEGSAKYMKLARAVRTCLHEYGIHSSTIQPEFCLDAEHNHGLSSPANGTIVSPVDAGMPSQHASRTASVRDTDGCLLECGDECEGGQQCCMPHQDGSAGSNPTSSHGHSH